MIVEFPDMKLDKLINDAMSELDDWVSKYSDAGVTDVTLIGILETYSTAIAYNLLVDEDE